MLNEDRLNKEAIIRIKKQLDMYKIQAENFRESLKQVNRSSGKIGRIKESIKEEIKIRKYILKQLKKLKK